MADSSSISNLKSEIRVLERLFGKDHLQFRFFSHSIDEVHCKFINGDQIIEIIGNLTDFYPQSPPIWFSDAVNCDNVIKELSNLSDNRLAYQVKILLTKLCETFNCQQPDELKKLDEITLVPTTERPDSPVSEDELESDDEVESMQSDIEFELDKTDDKVDDKDQELKKLMAVLKKVEASGESSTWTRQATNRLNKEIREFFLSESSKNKVFSIELHNDSIYDWNVRLLQIDHDSPLHSDLMKLRKLGKSGEILLNITFPGNYPFEPPFVRVVEPVIINGHVLDGGAMCMELLMKQGWSSVYTAESIIVQVAATLVRGFGRVDFSAIDKQNTFEAAKQGFKELIRIPDRGRWTSKFKDG